MDFSVVVPLHNEEGNVERLLGTLRESLARNPLVDRWEIVCVNDGSTDQTGDLLARHAGPDLRVVSLDRRSGQSAATAAGVAAARYDVVGRIDGDLQTTPDDFGTLLGEVVEGSDCAHGVRVDRRDPLRRRWASRVANAVRRRVIGDRFRDVSCPLTVFRKACLDGLPAFDGLHRYLPYLIEVQGYRVAEVPVRHFPRLAGKAKYRVFDRLGVGVRSLFLVRRLARELRGRAARR